jgi:hypothetical protein
LNMFHVKHQKITEHGKHPKYPVTAGNDAQQ